MGETAWTYVLICIVMTTELALVLAFLWLVWDDLKRKKVPY